jgi:hypothetical protein
LARSIEENPQTCFGRSKIFFSVLGRTGDC